MHNIVKELADTIELASLSIDKPYKIDIDVERRWQWCDSLITVKVPYDCFVYGYIGELISKVADMARTIDGLHHYFYDVEGEDDYSDDFVEIVFTVSDSQ